MNFLKIKDKKYFPGNIFFIGKTILLKVELLKKTKKRKEIKEENRENHKKMWKKTNVTRETMNNSFADRIIKVENKKIKIFPGKYFFVK